MSCDAETASYGQRLFMTAVTQGEAIDRAIRDGAANWDFSRIGFVEKNLLRLAIAELWFFPETPAKVVINEAVELAREYVGEESCPFINALLDRVYKQVADTGTPGHGTTLPKPTE